MPHKSKRKDRAWHKRYMRLKSEAARPKQSKAVTPKFEGWQGIGNGEYIGSYVEP